MHEPSESQRALLAEYREATEPSAAEIEGALTRLAVRVEGSSASAASSAARWRRRGRAGWAVAAGLAGLLVTGAAFAGAGLLSARPAAGDTVVHSQAVAVAEARAREELARERALSPQPEPAAEPDPVEVAPELIEDPEPELVEDPEPAPSPRRRAKPAGDGGAPAAPSASELADESRLLARARRALSDGDLEGALDWADEHARRHPKGGLSEERLVLEAVAACKLGRDARGRASLAELRRRFPGAPAIAEVASACE